jgi:hypothetical protein
MEGGADAAQQLLAQQKTSARHRVCEAEVHERSRGLPRTILAKNWPYAS